MRRAAGHKEGWVFPADTKSGHTEASTIKKQHARALALSGVAPFVLYTLRHTCITRWAKHIDPYLLHVIAGHTDMNTTKRYVHPNDADLLEAMNKARARSETKSDAPPPEVWVGHNLRHSDKKGDPKAASDFSVSDLIYEDLTGATRRD